MTGPRKLYCTCSEYTSEIMAKGKFGGCGIMRIRKPENYRQGRARNSQEVCSLVLHLSFPYSSAVDDNPNEQLWLNATIQRKA